MSEQELTMTTLERTRPLPSLPPLSQTRAAKQETTRMYAIVFDMDIESLRETYGDPYNNAYTEIRKILQEHGFNWQQGSTYFGGEQINAVTCVMAAIDLAKRLPWFSSSVRDIRMLRIEEMNDLMPAVLGATEEVE
jgi:virulence-associated protein VapD